jgi:AmiR/NasT family two-component response regulator
MESQTSRLAGKTFSVLVVDSHEAVRAILAQRLRREAAVNSVEEAGSVSDARRIIGPGWPDVVLLDPGGWQDDWRAQLQALVAIRTEGSIIALHVARPHNGYVNEAHDLGADVVVLKGMKTADLVHLLAREVGRASK